MYCKFGKQTCPVLVWSNAWKEWSFLKHHVSGYVLVGLYQMQLVCFPECAVKELSQVGMAIMIYVENLLYIEVFIYFYLVYLLESWFFG